MSGDEGPGVEIRDIQPDEYPAALSVLARGMRDNPLHIAAFGEDPERRRRCLEITFGALFHLMRMHTPLVALEAGTIVGVTGISPPGTCQPTNGQRLRLLPSLVSVGPRSLLRVARWTGAWGALDLNEPHSHLGPLAVDAHLKGRGIGSTILHEYCRRLDADDLTAYLETETEDNVRLYKRFGFAVIGEQRVIGVPNWFMKRPAEGS